MGSSTTERLDKYLSRPKTLKELCEEAGKGGSYRRIQQALRRWRNGTGNGLSPEDREWVDSVLDELLPS